jgi:hypothetical protein
MLANDFVNEELFAAFKFFEDCSDFSDLQHQWRETARQSLGTLFRRDKDKKSVCCGGAQPKVFGGLSRMRPLLGLEDSNTTDQYYPLPFIYVGWRVRDRVFPCLEVIEFPLGDMPGNVISEHSFRESARSGLRYVRLLRDMSQRERAESLERGLFHLSDARWIEEARRAIVLDAFDASELFPLVHFSRFDFQPRSESEQNYLKFCERAEKNLKWDFHMDRVFFHPDKGMSSPIRMKTFAVRRGEAMSF